MFAELIQKKISSLPQLNQQAKEKISRIIIAIGNEFPQQQDKLLELKFEITDMESYLMPPCRYNAVMHMVLIESSSLVNELVNASWHEKMYVEEMLYILFIQAIAYHAVIVSEDVVIVQNGLIYRRAEDDSNETLSVGEGFNAALNYYFAYQLLAKAERQESDQKHFMEFEPFDYEAVKVIDELAKLISLQYLKKAFMLGEINELKQAMLMKQIPTDEFYQLLEFNAFEQAVQLLADSKMQFN